MNLFEKDENKGMDIPDFVEEKDDTDSSVDMSIFKMSDDELYDDVKKEEKVSNKNSGGKKKSNSTIVLCLVCIGILLVTSIVSTFFAIREHSNAATLTDQVNQVKASYNDLQNQLNQANAKVEELTKQIEDAKKAGTSSDPNNKYPSGTLLYITEAGHSQGVRVSASKDADNAVDADGSNIVLYWGDEVTLTADATVDSNGVYWGKYDKGFFRIEVDGEAWASTEKDW